MALIPLKSFNRERREAFLARQLERANGIECPQCDAELWDTNPNLLMLTCPPMTRIHCKKCDFTGHRVI